ncbi:MAG: WYL domain-containing protein [Myxococcota bacterium]
MNRTERHDALIAELRARRGASMTDLAEALGVSVRTVRRDVAALRRRGFDIEGERGRGGGVRFARFAPLPPIQLDEEQAVSLWLSVEIARRIHGLPFSRGGSAGVNKLLARLPDERRHQLRRLCDRIQVGDPATPSLRASAGPTSPSLLDAFERAFREERCLGFGYVDRMGARTQRRVEPHGLYVELPVWYVLAIDVEKDARRMFRMDRISRPRVLQQRFAPKPLALDPREWRRPRDVAR